MNRRLRPDPAARRRRGALSHGSGADRLALRRRRPQLQRPALRRRPAAADGGAGRHALGRRGAGGTGRGGARAAPGRGAAPASACSASARPLPARAPCRSAHGMPRQAEAARSRSAKTAVSRGNDRRSQVRRRRRQRSALQPMVFGEQLLRRLDVRRIDRDAAHRAQLHALRLVEVAHALGAALGIDLVDLLAHRDRLVGALGLADIAVDALVGDPQGHGAGLSSRAARPAPSAAAAPRVPRTWKHHRRGWQSRARRWR